MIGTRPKPPPLWTSMNAVKSYYEHIHMTQTSEINDDLRGQLFNYHKNGLVFHAKTQIEKQLPDWVKNNAYVVVAGGCFASSLQGENLKDIDIFVLGHSSPVEEKRMHDTIKQKMVSSYLHIKDNTLDYVRDNDAVSEVWTETKKKIQFIFTHHASRKDLIKDFDYVHCTTSYQLGKLYITRKIFDAIMNKELIVNNGKNIQQWRKEKFLGRGYKDMAQFVDAEPTLGDILAGALKKVAQTSYVSYEDDALPKSWGPYLTNIAKNV